MFDGVIVGNCLKMKHGYAILDLATGKVKDRPLEPANVFPEERPLLQPLPKIRPTRQGGGDPVHVQPEPMKLRERGGLRPLKFDEVDYDEASLKTLNVLLAKIENRELTFDYHTRKVLRAVAPETLPKYLADSLKTKYKEYVQFAWDSELKDHFKRGSVILKMKSELPKDAKVLSCQVLTQWKKDTDGFITRAKARLIAKGYRQQAGVHFNEDEVSSPVNCKPGHKSLGADTGTSQQ